MRFFASSTLAGVIRLAAPRWSAAPQREGYQLADCPTIKVVPPATSRRARIMWRMSAPALCERIASHRRCPGSSAMKVAFFIALWLIGMRLLLQELGVLS